MVTIPSIPDPELPAIYGGHPAFPAGLPLARPSVSPTEGMMQDLHKVLESGILTNGPFVKQLEERAALYLGTRHCVAVASCTAGLMLCLRAMDLRGDVVVPSFTFAATAHAVTWNGLRPTFADIDTDTLTVSPESVARAVGVRTSAIMATHVYGTPCEVEALSEVAAAHGVRLLFDAAHAFGSRRSNVPIGRFGDAEVFSLSPTKVVVAGEGGIIATNDDDIAERCRIGRDYGNTGDYDCVLVGLNARMSEVHAAIALRSLDSLEERLARRNELAHLYRRVLAGVTGLSFPGVREGDRSTYKDFTVLVTADSFGRDAAWTADALAAEGIETRHYFNPPVHAMRAYRHLVGSNGSLPATESAASRVLTLPMWEGMSEEQVHRLGDAVHRLHHHLRA